jgi:hypothetical protein
MVTIVAAMNTTSASMESTRPVFLRMSRRIDPTKSAPCASPAAIVAVRIVGVEGLARAASRSSRTFSGFPASSKITLNAAEFFSPPRLSIDISMLRRMPSVICVVTSSGLSWSIAQVAAQARLTHPQRSEKIRFRTPIAVTMPDGRAGGGGGGPGHAGWGGG